MDGTWWIFLIFLQPDIPAAQQTLDSSPGAVLIWKGRPKCQATSSRHSSAFTKPSPAQLHIYISYILCLIRLGISSVVFGCSQRIQKMETLETKRWSPSASCRFEAGLHEIAVVLKVAHARHFVNRVCLKMGYPQIWCLIILLLM